MYTALISSIFVLVQVLSYFQADAWAFIDEYPTVKVRCHSKHFRRKVCIVDLPTPQAYICKHTITRQKSKILCVENVNYWVHADRIIVDHGCRAHFVVTMCGPMASCRCKGDPHCTSFDGKPFTYNGDCEYTMVRNKCDGNVAGVAKPDFEIVAKFGNRDFGMPDATWVVKIYIFYKGSVYAVDIFGSVTKNGRLIRLNYHDKKKNIKIYWKGQYIVFETTDHKWAVQLNIWSYLEIYFPFKYFGELCGLCGNYNGLVFDDWQLGPRCKHPLDPFEGPITPNVNHFGMSWTYLDAAQQNPQCVGNCNIIQMIIDPPEVCPDPNLLPQAEDLCGKTKEVADLLDCWDRFDTSARAEFEGSCVYDFCRAGNDSLCETFLNYVDFCSEEYGLSADDYGYFNHCRPECGSNEEYLACGDASPSCLEYFVPDVLDNDIPCVPGCFCLEGYYLDGNGDCVLPEDCGCAYENMVLEEGDIYFDEVECTLIECNANHTSTEIGSIDCLGGEQCTWDETDASGLDCV